MKRSFLIAALFLGGLVVHPAVVRGQTLSPVGTWEVILLGADKGTAMMTFSNDFTVSGYGIARKQFGLFTLTGTWAFSAPGEVVVAYVQTVNGVGSAVSFKALLLRNGRFRAKGTGPGGSNFHFKGDQPANLPDLSGSWTASGKRRGKSLNELYTVTASTNFPAVFDVTGMGLSDAGSFTLTGAIIASSRNQLNASIDRTFGVDIQRSSLFGKVKPSKPEMQLQGIDDTRAHLKLKVTQ